MMGSLSRFLNRTCFCSSQKRFFGVEIHPTAVIDGACKIGAGTRIWHFVHLFENSTIGENCILGQNVMVGSNVRIGDGCKVQNNVSLYEGVILEDKVFCGPSCVFTNVLNPRAEIERKHEIKTTRVRTGATIGANATIVCGVTIGEYAFVGAGSVVTTNVRDYEVVVGNPSQKIGYICKCGEMLPRHEWTEMACEKCAMSYSVSSSYLCKANVPEMS